MLTASAALRAAGEELLSTDKVPQGAAIPSTSRCSRRLHRHRHRPAEESTFVSGISSRTRSSPHTRPTAACGKRARGWSDGGGRATACPVNAGHEGLARTACTDFFGLFLLAYRLASVCVLVMWDGYVERPWDLDSDSQRKFCEFSVLCASRALCALARAAADGPRRFIARPACVRVSLRRSASFSSFR